MATEFQKSPNMKVLRDVVKLFHPKLTQMQLYSIKTYRKYNWVCIEFRIKNYGQISLGIDNHEIIGKPVFGPITMTMVNHLFENEKVGYRIWRFFDDELYGNEEAIQAEEANLFKKKIPLPSQKEFYDYYMKD